MEFTFATGNTHKECLEKYKNNRQYDDLLKNKYKYKIYKTFYIVEQIIFSNVKDSFIIDELKDENCIELLIQFIENNKEYLINIEGINEKIINDTMKKLKSGLTLSELKEIIKDDKDSMDRFLIDNIEQYYIEKNKQIQILNDNNFFWSKVLQHLGSYKYIYINYN